MPFWNPLRKPAVDATRCQFYAATLRVVVYARAELMLCERAALVSKPGQSGDNFHSDSLPSEFIPPRNNELVGKLLANLWCEDPVVLLLVHAALVKRPEILPSSGEVDKGLLQIASMQEVVAAALPAAYFMREVQAFIRKQVARCPDDCETRYDAVVGGLSACMRHNMQELRQTDEIFSLDYLFDCLKISTRLDAQDYLYATFCEMLVTTKQIIAIEREGPHVPRFETLQRELYTFMLRSAHTKPILWQMLKDPAASETFWPVVDMMRRHTCTGLVPKLLDVLPFLSENGKVHVIKALDSIGAVSALPTLQQLAQEKSLTVALPAAEAVRSFLRRSKSEAAQLLRAVDTQSTAAADNTLLRPAEVGLDVTRPEELLRPEVR